MRDLREKSVAERSHGFGIGAKLGLGSSGGVEEGFIVFSISGSRERVALHLRLKVEV